MSPGAGSPEVRQEQREGDIPPGGLEGCGNRFPEGHIGQAQRLAYGAPYGLFPRLTGADVCFSGNVPRFHAPFGCPPPYECPAPPVAQEGSNRLPAQGEGL